jgi:hypothetical protein
MKRVARIGIIVLVIGISLLFVTILRGSSPASVGIGSETASPDEWSLNSASLIAPRDVTLEVKANATIAVYVLDADGIKMWQSDGTLVPRWTFEDIEQDKFAIPITERGAYAVLTHNTGNSPAAVQLSTTISGYEQDLLWGSAVLIAAGIVVSLVSILKTRKS